MSECDYKCHYRSISETTSLLCDFIQNEASKLSRNLETVKNEAIILSYNWKGRIVTMSQDATKKAKDIIAEVSLKTFTFATQAKNDATQKAMTWTALLVEHFGDDLRTMYETAIHTLKVAITVLLFLSNSSIFVVGGITAFVIPQTMKEINQRLVDVWSGKKIPAVPVSRESSTESRNLLPTQPENSVEGSQGSLSPSESTTPELRTPGLSTRGKAVVVFATVFAWPIVFAAASFFVGAQVALNLQDDGIAI